MRTRNTSIEAYMHLITNGVLAEKNSIVYKHLYYGGATTQKKTERHFNDTTYTLRPRFAQLEKMGLIESVGEEPCVETGKKNMLWDVTTRVYPLDIEPTTKTKKQRVEETLNALRRLYSNTPSDLPGVLPPIYLWKEVANLINKI